VDWSQGSGSLSQFTQTATVTVPNGVLSAGLSVMG
jgi:hypothetical protein